MAKASELVALAQSWIGRKESNGTHKYIIDIYNNHKPLPRGYAVKYTDEWCATTISALAIKCDALDIIPKECSCQKMIELFKKIGRWKEADNYVPKPGDIIFYDWQDDGKGDNKGHPDHVGIVEKVEGKEITIIEGNYKESVKRRTLEVNARYVRGYGIPDYEPEAKPLKSIEAVAKEVVSGLWGNGEQRRKRLEEAGYDYDDIQEEVNYILSGKVESKYFAKYTGTSYRIDTVFAAIGVPLQYRGDVKKRLPIAKANGVKNYTGTYGQNSALIKLAKEGKLKKI